MSELTKEEITEIMEKIRSEYKETPIETKNPALRNLTKKLQERGFNFDPFSIVKEIDAEADKQFKKIANDVFAGLTVGALAAIKNEVIKWHNDEEVRFDAFRAEYLMKAAEVAPEKSESSIAIDDEIKEETSVQVAGYDPGRNLPNVVDEKSAEKFDEKTAEVTPIKSAKSTVKAGKAIKHK